MFIIGHTRFSVYSFEGETGAGLAAAQTADEEEYRRWLYDPERMAARTEIFTEEVLPQLARGIRDRDNIFHVVSYSSNLPAPYREALKEAESRYEFLRLNVQNSRAPAQLPPHDIVRSLLPWEPGQRVKFGAYRLDDDDLLAVDYFDRVLGYMKAARPGWKISFGYGFTGIRSDGKYFYLREDYSNFPSAGLMAVCVLNPAGRIIGDGRHGSHTKSNRYAPVITDSRHPAFFRGRNPTQDSLVDAHDKKDFLRRMHERLKHHSPVSRHVVLESFPALRGKLHTGLFNGKERVNLLPEPQVISSEGLTFPCAHPQAFTLAIDTKEKRDAHELAVLLAFEDEDGKSPDPRAWSRALEFQGIRHSRTLGFWVPVPHDEKGPHSHVTVQCPEGLRVAEVTLVVRRRPLTLTKFQSFPRLSSRASSRRWARLAHGAEPEQG
ncbi:glycosyltransferase [Nesterenkonia sp.]|uniref:glycosyltransferase n=1 Tax=Nesterenkonia sp. TaxID=704201 RepID=UPI00263248D8|nr:glycosyltransferase [Nesterenkonia sp.]